MKSPLQAMRELLVEDPRYKIEAYQFIREALQFAHEQMAQASGESTSPESRPSSKRPATTSSASSPLTSGDLDHDVFDDEFNPNHVTGQQLCEACRQYAVQQYGYLAKIVLASWGVQRTGDFGDLVYNLIRIEQMRKSDSDRREDFDDVYDFDQAFEPEFEFASEDQD